MEVVPKEFVVAVMVVIVMLAVLMAESMVGLSRRPA